MIEHLIKTATCRVTCGDESGTGWLIAKDRVITTRHCVLTAITDDKPVELFFQDRSDVAVSSKIVAQSEQWDACLLALDTTLTADPLPLSLDLPREGEIWQTFGYPQGKLALGHRLSGAVAQVLSIPKLKIDIDLSVDLDVALQVYRGMSGAVVVSEGVAVGMIRMKIDGTVAALSMHQLERFLTDNGVNLPAKKAAPVARMLADRGVFSQTFPNAVKARAGSYLFLEGAHGYGKSTFCSNFRSDDKTLINLGAYCLSDSNSALGADYRAQSQVFLDWLVTVISGLISGRPVRKEEKSQAEKIRKTAQYLDTFSKYCAKSGRQGMLFIDGLNEIPAGPLLGQFMGLLPSKLPPQITVVLTAPNFANIEVALAGKVKSTDIFVLPPLPDSACYCYCQESLKPERRSPTLVDRICDKAKGHPLYLRYLIEYANHQSKDVDLSAFPVLTGPIEEYYRGIWSKLLPDEGAVNLLALMARLRWGVPLADFAKALNPVEQAQFISVKSRIRHLLADEENTTIYHASFAAFIIENTAGIDEFALRRLAEFCRKEPRVRYCALNLIFHLLRAGDNSVFAGCNQDWFDTAVMRGVEPDALIADADAVVKRAAIEATADEFFRLTLLAQRISFRYNTLFAQSARLIAEALIVLGRPQEALQHVLRLKTLIVGPNDALQIGFLLHQHGYDAEAVTLLNRLAQRIIECYGDRMKLQDFIGLCSLHIQALFLASLASDGSGMKQVIAVMNMARRACEETLKDDPAQIDIYLRTVACRSITYFLSFRDEYAELARLKSQLTEIPQHYLPILCTALLQFESIVDNFHLQKGRKVLPKFFADIAELIPNSTLEAPLVGAVTDTLVRFGAPAKVVELFGTHGGKQLVRTLQLKAKNGVDVNHEDLQECLELWRVASFLDPEFCCPASGIFLSTGWLDAIERLIGALYWCDGRARRAKVDGDETARFACRDVLKSKVLDQLNFTLQQRASWHDSYAIPENALPGVYRQLAELLRDCFPEDMPDWLDNLVAGADGQWGMYSEGFRESAFHLMQQLTREKPCDELAARLLRLLEVWRDHVLRGVENRYELVPELQRIIPFFVYLGADEEAERLYGRLLSVSMGPGWYKEDQLGIMTEVLGSVNVSIEVWQRLPRIAGYLEKAAGEMTFQRYVRAEKSRLLGQIARQGRYRAAVDYFRRQCCGSTAELWAEAQQGPIDNVGPLKGNRFPGGALDEQQAVLALVRNSGTLPWALRWALLEIFHYGDSRYLTDYAEAFAKIANDVGAVPELVRRVAFITDAEMPTDERSIFASVFRGALKLELHASFATVLSGLPPHNLPKQTKSVINRETNNNDVDESLFCPGIFGKEEALRAGDKLLSESERQWALGNRQAAKALAVKVLQTAQAGGWGIWGDLSESARRAENMLVEGEKSATNVIRYYAPLLEAERNELRWRPAQHIIGKVASLFTDSENQRLLDAVIEHVRLMVGDSTQEIESFAFLANDTPEQAPTLELFRFIVWLCNHPKWLRRDRAAAMVLWLVEQLPELLSVAVTTAFSMEEGNGPEVLCGVLDGSSARDPVALWDKLTSVVDIAKVLKELRHVSRISVLKRLAARADKVGSSSAKFTLGLIQASFTGQRGTGENPELPRWAGCLAHEWRHLENLVDMDVVAAWQKELERMCFPLVVPESRALEQAVSLSFQENNDRPLNRWESKLRHALNLALWSHISEGDASDVEAILRSYNPSQPERTMQGMRNPLTDQLFAAIDSGDYSAVLGSNATVLLNYHDMVVNPAMGGTHHVEVLCLLQPASKKRGFFSPEPTQSFRSSELPMPLMEATPVETCCRLSPELVFFGAFTPAIPLPFFQMLSGAKDEDFVRQNWRCGRRNTVRAFGQPMREGCSLSVARQSLTIPLEFKLAWIIWLDGKVHAFVDENDKSLI